MAVEIFGSRDSRRDGMTGRWRDGNTCQKTYHKSSNWCSLVDDAGSIPARSIKTVEESSRDFEAVYQGKAGV